MDGGPLLQTTLMLLLLRLKLRLLPLPTTTTTATAPAPAPAPAPAAATATAMTTTILVSSGRASGVLMLWGCVWREGSVYYAVARGFETPGQWLGLWLEYITR